MQNPKFDTTARAAAAIRRKRASLDRQQAALTAAIQILQIECTHPTPHMKYGGSSGNYDPSSDGYWIDWNCQDCGKRWTTGQGFEHTSKYPNAIKVRA